MRLTFRPLIPWPYPKGSRNGSPFGRAYGTTPAMVFDSARELLAVELEHLGADTALIGTGHQEQDIRIDGLPGLRAVPVHPGVEVSFDSKRGRLVYHTDEFETWQQNLRAIAKGLEALRAVDRYGITTGGQQYAGFLQLPPGRPDAERGRQLVTAAGGIRQALLRHHPDHGGDARDFADVQAYRERTGGGVG